MFDGKTYDRSLDFERLNSQLERVKHVMEDGNFHTLTELTNICGGTESAISARIRDLRKEKFGNYTIIRKRVEDNSGLHEYRLKPFDEILYENIEQPSELE